MNMLRNIRLRRNIILDNSTRTDYLDQDSPIEGLRMTDPLLEETFAFNGRFSKHSANRIASRIKRFAHFFQQN
jgi:hypothetical protein